ncbi:hypothetical protein ACFE04_011075 [Oxalis oulophora]
MQSKINSFFKPSPSSATHPSPTLVNDDDDDLAIWEKSQHKVYYNTYTRQPPKPHRDPDKQKPVNDSSKRRTAGNALNKKRTYTQLHLELGQSDFLLHTCSTCGVKYARGEEEDEKSHKAFHKDFTHGFSFKGWRKERVIPIPPSEDGRILLVLNSDPAAQMNKVQEVVKRMELELGEEWIYHKLCKVYLFISSQRIAGCLVAEPIKQAFKVLSDSAVAKTSSTKDNNRSIKFGEIILQREVIKRSDEKRSDIQCGAVICEEDEAVPAVCGVRAIWVAPSKRRNRIASRLLDALRRNFCEDNVLQRSELAFSEPTSAGKELATNYVGAQSFLVYNTSKDARLVVVGLKKVNVKWVSS